MLPWNLKTWDIEFVRAWVHSPSPAILVGSFRPASWSELVRKEELGEAFVDNSLQMSAEIFLWETPASLSWELLEVTAFSCLAPAWTALWPCSCQAGTLLMGALTLPWAFSFLPEPQACLFTWTLLLPAVVPLCLPSWDGALVQQWSCAAAENDEFLHYWRRIESAWIIEDDIPGFLGIQTQSLPARGQLLPKIMNTHHGIHQQQNSERAEKQSLCCSKRQLSQWRKHWNDFSQ